MKFSMKLRAALAAIILANKNLSASLTGAKTEFSAEEQATFDANVAKAKNLKSQIATAEAQEALEAEAEVVTPTILTPEISGGGITAPERKIVVPATARQSGSLRVFKTREQAYAAAVFVGCLSGYGWAKQANASANLFNMNALQSEGINTDGGYSVPEEFSREMIILREKKGIFRQKCRVIPMVSDTFSMGRRVSGLTAYPVAEGVAGTVSTAKQDRVKLVAQKWMVLATLTKELNADSAINWIDMLFEESAYALAVAEDNAGFNGDGTGTYSGIVGLANALQASCKVTQGTGSTWGAIVLADINALMAKLPDYQVPLEPEFYCNKAFFDGVLTKLAMAAGGVTATEIVNGVMRGKFFGYTVNFVSSMPRITASAHIPLYFGDLRYSSKFGDRAGLRMEMTEQGVVGGVELFSTDEIGIKTVERFDIANHERGTTTSTDAGGPMNALVTG